jgi:hypothetical protein
MLTAPGQEHAQVGSGVFTRRSLEPAQIGADRCLQWIGKRDSGADRGADNREVVITAPCVQTGSRPTELTAADPGKVRRRGMCMSVRGMRLPPAVPFLSRRGSPRWARTAPARPGPQPRQRS